MAEPKPLSEGFAPDGYITDQDCFSYGTDPKKNNILYSLSDYYHTDYLVPYYFWNYLKILFKL